MRAPQLAYTEASCCRTVRFVPSSAQGLGRNYLPAANRTMPHLSLAPMRMGVGMRVRGFEDEHP